MYMFGRAGQVLTLSIKVIRIIRGGFFVVLVRFLSTHYQCVSCVCLSASELQVALIN